MGDYGGVTQCLHSRLGGSQQEIIFASVFLLCFAALRALVNHVFRGASCQNNFLRNESRGIRKRRLPWTRRLWLVLLLAFFSDCATTELSARLAKFHSSHKYLRAITPALNSEPLFWFIWQPYTFCVVARGHVLDISICGKSTYYCILYKLKTKYGVTIIWLMIMFVKV